MKIYLLYDNPYDEGDEIYGAFSTEEKANEAFEIFSEVSLHELYIHEIELDHLEKYYDVAKSGLLMFVGHRSRHAMQSVWYGDWSMNQCGFDWMLDEVAKKDTVVEFPTHVSATIIAKSKDEAIEIADKILKEKKKEDGYLEWME